MTRQALNITDTYFYEVKSTAARAHVSTIWYEYFKQQVCSNVHHVQ